MRIKEISLVLFLFIISYTNSYSQIWTQCTNGLYATYYGVNCLGKQDSILFASPSCNGVYRSTDNVINWFHSLSAGCVYNFYNNGAEIFACTSSGLFSSTDYGQNWSARGFNTGYTDVSSIIKSGANLVLGLQYSHTVYYSTNNGINWISSNITSNYSTRNFVNIGNTLFDAASGGVFASTDNGVTWQERNAGLVYTDIFALSYFNGALYAGGEGFYKSTNDGLYWSRCDNGFFNNGYGLRSLVIHNGLLFAGTYYKGIYKSSDGSNWISAITGFDSTNLIYIPSLLSYNSTLFAASSLNFGNSGLFATTNNGQNWYTSGFEGHTVNSVIENNNTIFIGTDVTGIYSSTDYGDSWYRANLDMKNKKVLCLAKQNSLIYTGTRDSGVYKSSNSGQNWIKSNSGLNNYSINSLYTKDSIVYCGTNSGAYKTTNSGDNWSLFGLLNTQVSSFYVFNNYYFAGTNNGIRISTNGGTNWATNLTGDSIYSFYNFSDKLLAGTNHGLKVSTDFGSNWVSIGLNNYRINTITNMADTLITSTNLGVFATTNMGNNWINLGPKDKTCGVIILNNKIYAGGVNCVWKRDANILTGVSIISTVVPDKYILHQNYPNPFNPNTKIKFDIPKTTSIKLTIFDITGKEVKVLVNDILQPGTYESNWNADNLSSGIYFYKLTTQNFSETKKMLLLK